ncbi:hypothetical protein GGQ87_000602 [Brevundimonas alba]|uniref:Uncharacterized protein n=1 Tax=Brevundimonas alba TaxID=74314 RepID=A0A7X5YKG7_9CAUL|nr:hypothetical protein [Brevundimonas alba]NJC40344.1 hypothetical protein [Brevundimonas alba]
MATGMNEAGKAGHHERNKVEGEGETNASGGDTTSSGFGGDMDDIDPDAPSPTDLSGRTEPSMRTAVAQPGTHDPEDSSFAPGGDKTSNPDVDGEAMLDQTVGRADTGRH